MEELFQRLSETSSNPLSTPPSSQNRQASISSPIVSPPQRPQPQTFLSANSSKMSAPHENASATPRTTDLLSLLTFRPASGSNATPPAGTIYDNNTSRDNASGNASLAGSMTESSAAFARRPNTIQSPSALAPAASRPELRGEASGSSSNPQDFLLRLLNQAPKASPAESSLPQTPQKDFASINRVITPRSSSVTRDQPLTSIPDPLSFISPPPADGHRETVAEAVSGVGEVAGQQVEQALALANSTSNGDSSIRVSEAEKIAVSKEDAPVVAPELPKKENVQPEESSAPAPKDPPASKHVRNVSDVQEEWEAVADQIATTYTLPMQPFKSISILATAKEPVLVPQDITMDIARVKCPFDQIDRNLVAATQNLMAYPLRSSGIRVIRQATGAHKQVFKQIPERVFNVSLNLRKKGGSSDAEVALATGVDGSVFWVPLSTFAASDDADPGEDEHSRGFVFPPVPTSEESTSGGQLKTRVKLSTRHPEYFAYGRGKSIYIIYPKLAGSKPYVDQETYKCRSEKYLKEHMLRISTGKAGKDFIFSADDSLILSLDKAGRLKFWDVRHLLIEGYERNIAAATPLELKVPLMTLSTCPASEKSWPTSIHLIDKEKPMTKGIALRYVIIGLKQNHTLQLWDLTLGKPVQEIQFPHDQESDAICSVIFHPKTSILTVAHPTRNSIYFMHLSIPPYALTPMSQSKFVTMVAEKDANLLPPQSTIIVNGFREFKFSDTVTIRSADILAEPGVHFGDEAPAFVLYVMHSNGITEVKVDRSMLGLNEAGRIAGGSDAAKAGGVIKVVPLRTADYVGDAGSITSEAPSLAPGPVAEEPRKAARRSDQTPTRTPKPQDKDADSSAEKIEKKSKKKKEKQAQQIATPPTILQAPTPIKSVAVERAPPAETVAPIPVVAPAPEASESKTVKSYSEIVAGTSQDTSSAESVAGSGQLESLLRSEFETLQHSIYQDRLEQDAIAVSRQEAVLKAVSRTLTENVEDSLARVVTEGLTKVTISPLKDVVVSAVDRQLTTSFNQAVKASVPRELQKLVPAAVSQSFKEHDVVSSISEHISKNIAQQVDSQIKSAITASVTPAVTKIISQATKQITSDFARQLQENSRSAETREQVSAKTITDLQSTVSDLQKTISEMAQAQQAFQQQATAMLSQLQAASTSAAPAAAPEAAAPQQLSPSDQEREDIRSALAAQDYEEATLKWMHSARKAELFHEIFLFQNPNLVFQLSALLNLSVAATVSEDLTSHLPERLRWVDTCANAIDLGNINDLQEVMHNVLDVLIGRINQTYMQVSTASFSDPSLKTMHLLNGKLSQMRDSLRY